MQISKSIYILLCLLVVSWLQPLHILPWVSLHSEALAFAAVLFSAIYEFLGRRRNVAIEFPQFTLWILLFAMLVVMQHINNQIHYFGDLIVYLLYMYVVMLALVLGYMDDKSEDILVAIGYFIMVAGLITTLIMLLQGLGIEVNSQYVNPMPSARRPGGNMGQPNHAATLLVMAIVSSLYLKAKGRLSMQTLLLAFSLLALGLAMSESRSGLISFLILASFLTIKYQQLNYRYANQLMVGLVCIQQLLWWVWPPFFSWFWSLAGGEIGAINRLSLMSGNIRLLVWREIVDAVLQNPWLGWGWGQLPKALATTATKYEVSAPFTYSHNIFLDIAAAFGIPVFTLVVLGFIRIAFLCFCNMGINGVFWCICLLLPIGVHSLLEFPYAYAYFLIPAALILGVILRVLTTGKVIVVRSVTVLASTVCVAVLATWVAVEYISLEEDFAVARFESMRIGEIPPSYSPRQAIILNQLEAMVHMARMKPAPNMNSEMILQLREVAQRFPSVGFQNRYALALALNNQPEEAMQQLKVIRVMQGDATYERLAPYWRELAATEYPQLGMIVDNAF